MSTLQRWTGAVLFILLGLTACAPLGPSFGSIAATLPPLQPGQARIFMYRWLEPYETTAPTTAYLNGVAVGLTETGSVLYRDVPAGRYLVSVYSEGVFPNQFKTITVKPGDVFYARIESIRSWSPCGGGETIGGGATSGCWDTFVVNFVDPYVAQSEMQSLRFIKG